MPLIKNQISFLSQFLVCDLHLQRKRRKKQNLKYFDNIHFIEIALQTNVWFLIQFPILVELRNLLICRSYFNFESKKQLFQKTYVFYHY